MKLSRSLRYVHRWGAVVIALPLALTITTGILLLVKKQVAWIQPPTQRGSQPEAVPARTLDELFAAARSVEEAGIEQWTDLERVDFKAGRGIVKFVSRSRWEVQVDTESARVLQVAERRSDLIESLHDGSFFAGWTKLGVWLPAGVVLLALWVTGIYMFGLPYVRRAQRRRRR